MNGRSMVMLVVAVLCGLGAMYGVNRLMAQNKRAAPVVAMQDVLVAVRDLKIEEVIKPELVTVERMAKTAVPAGAFSSVKDVEGRWVMIGMLANEPLLDRKLAARGSPPGLVSRIPKGMRAFAIEVNEQTGVSGFVLPDHRVDVVQIEPGQNGRPEAEPVLQDVLVLASGTTFTRPEDRSIQSRTVTLAVTPEQVDTLVSSRSRGALSLSLRGLNDHIKLPPRKKVTAPVPPPGPVVVAVKPPEPPPLPPPAPEPVLPPPPRFLTVYRGLDSVRRVRIDQPTDPETGEAVAPAPARARVLTPSADRAAGPRN